MLSGTIPAGYLLKKDNPEAGSVDLSTLSGKNIIIFAPGAFTPPCSSHVPGYIEKADQFKQKGIKSINVVTVNDLFTIQAWEEKLGGAKDSEVTFLADDNGALSAATGLLFDASGLLGNARSKRAVLVVDNNTVSKAFVEDSPPDVKVTAADHVLQSL